MIRRLRRNFILIAMGSLLAVLVVIVGAINTVNHYQSERRSDGLLQMLSDNRGVFPEVRPQREPPPRPGLQLNITQETPFETRYFWAKTDKNGQVIQTDTGHIAAVDDTLAQELAARAVARGREQGYLGVYKYRITPGDGETFIVFVDCAATLDSRRFFLLVSCAVAACAFLVVLLPVTVFSGRAIRPVAESFEKQQRFITDAGHELKTPLAIIAANADVLALEAGDSQWLDSIRTQTRRLDGLVKGLLSLSRMEEGASQFTFLPFDLSAAVTDTAEAFYTIARKEGKALRLRVEPGITLNGDESAIRQLVSILTDNAVKYCAPGGEIALTLSGGARGAVLAVQNPCHRLPEGDLNRLFDRFYRADPSRTRGTGGYGIGLSAARAITAAHGGKISVRAAGEREICFTVVL